MLNFAVGPVQLNNAVLQAGGEQIPYFRTEEFSDMMLENESAMQRLLHADRQSRTVFLTGSGTAAMEASVMNCLTQRDRALVVNGGSFGQRFVELCKTHHIPFDEIKLAYGMPLTKEILYGYNAKAYTAFLFNLHETSTGVLYDANLIGSFCKENHLFLIVDAISSFLADALDMQEMSADVVITSSQKALACPPGISMLTLSSRAIERIDHSEQVSMYLDLKSSLRNGIRGQTPFTPAVGILRQLHVRLKEIEAAGGVMSEIAHAKQLAEDFRYKIKDLPVEIFSKSLSNALTALRPLHVSAGPIFRVLKNEYGIWVCPNGGDLADQIFRVGHIGALTTADNTQLVNALYDLWKRRFL